ncbi:MFS transporter [Rhodococcus wratislaviensis]|uniref:Putative major facilitator superfamily transporter n=1 Tax=Rhodococcus wratislaviensis NBRC 100605 TaxID=1219028 RepID=X0Q1W6_RHOWR|nr:MFS transporter [Rhodococcus wratislaviensis]GAF50033.1 putative major facilitator superfamily transporter [Rhodococcus wratislaviensis NBRC 100605]
MDQPPPSRTEIFRVDDAPLLRFHKRLALHSAGGPFLDGYVLSIIGIAMVQITPQWGLHSAQQGLVAASASLGIFFGSFLGGRLTDRFGRRGLYTVDLVAVVVFSVAQFWVDDFWWLVVLRVLIGVAIGADYPVATSLLTEFTPKKYRGPFIGSLTVMWFVGAAVAYVVGDILARVSDQGWRWLLVSAAVPAALTALARIGTPESPRWLASQGRIAEADDIITSIFGPHAVIENESGLRAGGVGALWKSGYLGRILFVTAFWTAAIVPLFAVYAFGPKILAGLGLDGRMANMSSAVITILLLVGCVLAMATINKLGRRTLLIQSFAWSGSTLLLLGLFPDAPTYVILCLFASYAIFTGGAQVLQLVYPNELFPTEIRGRAVGLASSLSRVGGALGTYMVPTALDRWGVGPTMLGAAAVTVTGLAVSVAFAPETRGKSLADTARI